jgi:hypothetical protein
MKYKWIFIGMSFALVGMVLTQTYRPYVYENTINDFHFADTIGNLFAVPSALFFLSGIRKNATKINCSIPTIVIAFILFEVMGLVT